MEKFIGEVDLVRAVAAAEHFHGKEGYVLDFFYSYSIMFKDMSVKLPFKEFQMGILRELNMAPT